MGYFYSKPVAREANKDTQMYILTRYLQWLENEIIETKKLREEIMNKSTAMLNLNNEDNMHKKDEDDKQSLEIIQKKYNTIRKNLMDGENKDEQNIAEQKPFNINIIMPTSKSVTTDTTEYNDSEVHERWRKSAGNKRRTWFSTRNQPYSPGNNRRYLQ